MTYTSTADEHRRLAERAVFEHNVAAARAAVRVAKEALAKAEAELAKYVKENS